MNQQTNNQQTKPTQRTMQTEQINRQLIHPHPANADLYGAPAIDHAFCDHIRQFGIQQPIVLAPHPTLPGQFITLGGHRRMAAAEHLGLATVPCTLEHPQTDDEAILLLVGLNLQRDKTVRMKVKEFLQLEHLQKLGVELTTSGDAKSLENQVLTGGEKGQVSARTKSVPIAELLDAVVGAIGTTYREARRMYTIFSAGYRDRQIEQLRKKKVKEMGIDQMIVTWDDLREKCMAEEIGLQRGEEEVYALIKRTQRRKETTTPTPPPPRTKPMLLIPFAGDLETEISTFAADDVQIAFGSVFHDMELRPAVKVAGVTHLVDIRTLYDLHIKPTLKKEMVQ